MLSRSILLVSLIFFTQACGNLEQDSDLDSMPRDLVTCLKGGSCKGYTVKTGATRKNFEGVFSSLWAAYPDTDSATVKSEIGGNVNADWITNTCVIRLSRALNAAGGSFLVPKNFPGLTTVSGGDGKRYAFRVVEIAKYLLATYGLPQVRKTSDIKGRKGIVLYDREGWSDANGHFDMWDGSTAKYTDYTSESTNVFIWE
jgi:hypothetical protein